MLISIITVNYNNKIGLESTIESVQSQTYKDVEHIVIDGYSTDGSKDIISKYKNSFSYSVIEPDKGIYNAMNKGITVAKGEYVLFLNSGDTFYSKEALSFFTPYLLDKHRKDIIYGNIAIISKKERIKTYPSKLSFSYFTYETLPHLASLIKKTCFNEFLYDEQLRIVSDWKFFMIGICKKKFSYQYIDKVISSFYLDGISTTMPQLVAQEKQKVLNEEFFWYMRIKRMKQSINIVFKKIKKIFN